MIPVLLPTLPRHENRIQRWKFTIQWWIDDIRKKEKVLLAHYATGLNLCLTLYLFLQLLIIEHKPNVKTYCRDANGVWPVSAKLKETLAYKNFLLAKSASIRSNVIQPPDHSYHGSSYEPKISLIKTIVRGIIFFFL